MIHLSYNPAPWPATNPVLHLSIVGEEDVQMFRQLLGRALNTADPQKTVQFVELADQLDQALVRDNIPIPS